MCSHCWKKVNDIKVCINCGLTVTYDNKILFDKPIVDYKSKPRKRVTKQHDENVT